MPSTSNSAGPPSSERLTPRERECLQLVAEHLSSKEIARRLGLSQHTVDGHLHEARRKLGAPTRRDAVRMFLQEDGENTPPSNVGGQSDAPFPPLEGAPFPPLPPSSGPQFSSLAEAPAPVSREASIHEREGAHDLGVQRLDAPAAYVPQPVGGPLRPSLLQFELSPAQRLAAIVVIAAASALVLLLLLAGARELTFLIERMTSGG